MADSQEHLSITGGGIIDGQGRAVALNIDSLFYIGKLDSADYTFPEMRPKWYLRPQLIEFVNCKHVEIKNVILLNAACWVQTYDRCDDVVIDHVFVNSDAYWNNDGIDIQDCKNVRITHCSVNSSDDGICLKSQSPDHACENIYVGHCKIRSSASAVKFGTVSHGGFKNVTIEDIQVYDTFRSAIAIECVDGGYLEDVTVDSIDVKNTGNAIFIRLGQRNSSRPPGTLKNVCIKNMNAYLTVDRPDSKYEIRGPELPFFHNPFPSSITGIPGHPVENVTLENINIMHYGKGNNGLANMPLSRLDQVPEKINAYPEFSMFGELPSWGFYVRHVDGLIMKNVNVFLMDAMDYRPAMIFDDVTSLTMKSCKVSGDHKPTKIVLHNTGKVKFDDDFGVIKM
jgi:polygalacturonase